MVSYRKFSQILIGNFLFFYIWSHFRAKDQITNETEDLFRKIFDKNPQKKKKLSIFYLQWQFSEFQAQIATLYRRVKNFKKNLGLSVHQVEPFLGISDLKLENCQNKGHPNLHFKFCRSM